MQRNSQHRTDNDAGPFIEEDTLADQILELLGGLMYCAEDRLDEILRGLPGMASIRSAAFGSVRTLDDRRDPSGAGLADLDADFAIGMTLTVLVIQLADAADGERSPAELARQRRAVAARTSVDGRQHILLMVGGGTAVTAASAADLAPVCSLRWSDLAHAVRRLTNPASVERRLLAQLAALPDAGAKPVVASRLKPLHPMRIRHARFLPLAASLVAAAIPRSSDENARHLSLRPLVGAGITTTIFGRIG